MATNSQIPFSPQGPTIAITAAGSPPSGVQASVVTSIRNSAAGQYRIVNTGNVTVHLGIGTTATLAQTNAVAPTSGNPQYSVPLVAGAVEILRFAPDSYFSGLASEETTLYITPGEGI